MAMRHNVIVQVLSSQTGAKGTFLTKEDKKMENELVSGIAYTKDEALDLGGAFRRAKKYMEYAPTDSRFLSVRGVKVERFAYLPYSENWKTHKK